MITGESTPEFPRLQLERRPTPAASPPTDPGRSPSRRRSTRRRSTPGSRAAARSPSRRSTARSPCPRASAPPRRPVATLSVQAARITSLRLEFTGTAVGFDDLVWGTAPVSPDDAFQTGHNAPLSVPAAGVLANDADADGDAVTAVLSRGAANGTVRAAAGRLVHVQPAGGVLRRRLVRIPGQRRHRERERGERHGPGRGAAAAAARPRSPRRVTIDFAAFRKFTRLRVLAVNDAARRRERAHRSARPSARGSRRRGCPYKSRTVKSSKARSQPARAPASRSGRRKLPVGTRLTITITAPNAIGKQFRYTMRARKRPSRKRLCVPPGGRAGKCT